MSTTARLTPPLILRAQPRLISMAAVLCMLLIGVTAYDTIHVHRSLGPLESAPLTSHHCLLCLAAHLPVTVKAGPAVPLPTFTCTTAVPSVHVVSYESATSFPLYTRPPPQV